MSTVSDTIRNGVDTENMFATLDLIKEQPELARFQFRATNRWVDGAHNRSTIQGFYAAGGEDTTRSQAFALDAGEPAILLGTDTGPNPAEYSQRNARRTTRGPDGIDHPPKITRQTESTMRKTIAKSIARQSPNRRHHASREPLGRFLSTTMQKARKAVFGVLATLLLAAVPFAVPAGPAIAATNGSGTPSAAAAKKKCKKGYVRKTVRKKQKCVKKRRTAPTHPRRPRPPPADRAHEPRADRAHEPRADRAHDPAPAAPTAPAPTAPTNPGPTAPAWNEGRWAGHYAENGVELLFNVLGGQLYTGGFDDFFVDANCPGGVFNPDPDLISPVQASIASNGDFSGSGVYQSRIPWQLSGHISGKSITGGTFTVGPYNDFSGVSCSGTTHFTGQWIASYTL